MRVDKTRAIYTYKDFFMFLTSFVLVKEQKLREG